MTAEPLDIALREWEKQQPDAATKDPLWTLNCYRAVVAMSPSPVLVVSP